MDGVPEFWNIALNTSMMDKELKRVISSGVRMDGLLNIGYETYMKIPVLVPSLPEQHKIAAFLSDFDAAISTSKRELEAYKQLKRGFMQRMFV